MQVDRANSSVEKNTLSSLRTTANQKRGKDTWKYVVTVIAVVIILTFTAVLFASRKDGDSDVSPTPTVALGIEEYSVSKTSENDALFNVTIKNHASTSEAGLLVCRITPSNHPSFYSNLSVSMYPNETRTVQITVDVPADAIWVPVTPSSQVDCYFA